MINNLNEINRVLITIDKLKIQNKGANFNSVIQSCRSQVIEARFPNHKETIEFSTIFGILKRSKNRLKMTSIGEHLLRLNRNHSYIFSSSQKDLFVKKCLLSKKSPEVTKILRQFSPAYSTGTYKWSPSDDSPLSGDLSLLEVMKQANLIIQKNTILEVNQKYVELVQNLLEPTNFLSIEQLAKRLKIASIVGKIAEDIILDFEKNRLEKIGCVLESECIQKISDLDVSAGYDIASFNGKNKNLIHDRFIEVKGSTSSNIEFYWTKNEINKAKELGQKYWLYFVGNINIKNKKSMLKPILIQNPTKNILSNSQYYIDCVQFFVKKRSM